MLFSFKRNPFADIIILLLDHFCSLKRHFPRKIFHQLLQRASCGWKTGSYWNRWAIYFLFFPVCVGWPMSLLPWSFGIIFDYQHFCEIKNINCYEAKLHYLMLYMATIYSVFKVVLIFTLNEMFFIGKKLFEWSTFKFEICYLVYVPHGLRTIN